MSEILNSYLRYARGEKKGPSFWSLLKLLGAVASPLIRARNALYDRGALCSIDPPIPVISVGNLCHGGTNKTPMVEMLSRKLTEAGLSVGIVSRGYGGETKSPLWVGQDRRSSDRKLTGDEPLMLARRLPNTKVVVSRDRYEGVRLLQNLGANVAVADDAFQHRRMGRDLDMVLIDATCPFGNRRLFPTGILREGEEALSRADIVVITKVEQASAESVDATREEVAKWIDPGRIFTARVTLESWMVLSAGELREFEPEWGQNAPEGHFITFSAIGHSDSFYRSLLSFGLTILENRAYRDHHRFSWRDLDDLERRASELGATGFICTEKDIHNMPENLSMLLPLYVPRITVSMDEDAKFRRELAERVRPHFVVASNGYGEDAIGALLASRIKKRFPSAAISAFTLVGVGREYRDRDIEVISPPSELPSAGIVKYSLKALFRDLRHGLRGDIKKQIDSWRKYGGRFRTPLCVGDVYLLAHTLWGRGLSPVLVATAKSVMLRGHWWAERCLLRMRARRVWTRDIETESELRRSGVDAVFDGNPIMDLAIDADLCDDPWGEGRPRVLLLPGSRPRAYDDISLLLDAVKLLDEKISCAYVMVLAPTIEKERLLASVDYKLDGDGAIIVGGASVATFKGPIARAAYGADILIGLGGTANQVSAGLGVPVVSIVERGKLIQKKLLQDAEILVPPTPKDLSEASAALLLDPVRRCEMSRAGIKLLGGPGALNSVVEYASRDLGWNARVRLYETLLRAWAPEALEARAQGESGGGEKYSAPSGEVEEGWKIPEKMRIRVARLVKIMKKITRAELAKDAS
ncbi:MAG: tetraacyldisaccharide 4'-kinase [Synergistaceae bacterium]|jgi:tetraacyldisaccharide 4'-kinase|nr:tetraacyldisaccharide 4'-kinase [Synergistaceae bacterium]